MSRILKKRNQEEMTENRRLWTRLFSSAMQERAAVLFLVVLMLFPFDYLSIEANAQYAFRNPSLTAISVPDGQDPPERRRRKPNPPVTNPNDSTTYLEAEMLVREPIEDTGEEADTTKTVVTADDYPYGLDGKKIFNPSPTRAVWLSALFPGLGQIYNRRYWKLPIVVGGFMGLGYATSWNNGQYQDYMQGYRDLIDNDPSTKSYMDFFPPTTNESDLDRQWLQNVMQQRKDYYRRNRDLCIICLVAMYLICMVDAYVDASLAHFDISPGLSMDLTPTMIQAPASRRPAVGLNWAFNF